MGYSILQKIVEKKRKLMMLTRSAEDAWIMEEKKIIEKTTVNQRKNFSIPLLEV